MFLDIAVVGLLITCSGWLLGVLEEGRKRIYATEVQVERNNGRIELLEVELCTKLENVIFRLEVIEKKIGDRN